MLNRTASSDLTDTVEVVNKKNLDCRNIRNIKTSVLIFIMIFEKMWDISLSLCLNIPIYPQVQYSTRLAVKAVNNTHDACIKTEPENQKPEKQTLYIPHLYVKTFGGLSPGGCWREAATPPITAPHSTGRLCHCCAASADWCVQAFPVAEPSSRLYHSAQEYCSASQTFEPNKMFFSVPFEN